MYCICIFSVLTQHMNYVNSPNIQTSLADVNLLKLIDSGAIHLIGSLPLEAETKTKRYVKITHTEGFYNYIQIDGRRRIP